MFSKVSRFAALNNLRNISRDPSFATICGYAAADLDTVLAPELARLDRDEVEGALAMAFTQMRDRSCATKCRDCEEPIHLAAIAGRRSDRTLLALRVEQVK